MQLAERLQDFKKPYEHSAVTIARMQEQLDDLTRMVSRLLVRVHRLEHRGVDE